MEPAEASLTPRAGLFERVWALFFMEAIRALAGHKLRSGLTTLGISIGIAAVVLVVAIGEASTARVKAELEALGENFVWVEAGSRNIAGARTGAHGTTSLTQEDAEAIVREVPLIKRMSPQVDGTVLLIAGSRTWTTRYRGESPDYLAIKKWTVIEGASLSDQDVETTASKLLIGQTVREQLFGAEQAVGREVRIGRQLFVVSGVLGGKGQSADGRDQDDWILLPHTTAQSKLRGGQSLHYLDDILCSATSPGAVKPAIEEISALLRQRHHIEPGQEDDFNIRRPDEVLKAQVDASNSLSALLIGIASVALLVGGIGIMNVMLAAVAQRTREIGLRLAVGATATAIRTQFLGEAVVLCVLGGAAGVAASHLGALLFETTLGFPVQIPPAAIALALGASVGVGVFFGYYPASRAAGLDPIVALRQE
jgi:putative ABC transport system permease protein